MTDPMQPPTELAPDATVTPTPTDTRQDACPSCGSPDRFIVRGMCAADSCDGDAWHRSRPAAAPSPAVSAPDLGGIEWDVPALLAALAAAHAERDVARRNSQRWLAERDAARAETERLRWETRADEQANARLRELLDEARAALAALPDVAHAVLTRHADECERQGVIHPARVSAVRHAANVVRMELDEHIAALAAAPSETEPVYEVSPGAFMTVEEVIPAAPERCAYPGALVIPDVADGGTA